MAKKQKTESDDQQYQRFLEKVREMVDAGELSPTEADKAFDRSIATILPLAKGRDESDK